MNFASFQIVREKLLRRRGDVADCAETNLYRALGRLVPPPTPAPEGTVHRCHLAEAWVKRFEFSAESARCALVSGGVRDSLDRLFRHYATGPVRLWVPEDNYPVFGELACAAGLQPKTFPTLSQPQWPTQKPEAGTELLLVTNPLKPLGRWLDRVEVAGLIQWLAQSPQRRLLLDTVYTFDTRFHDSTLELFATGQTLLLHSLTKGWLAPRCFGITLVPEADAPALTPVFREQPPPQANLARARALLSQHPTMPLAIAGELARARQRLLRRLPGELLCVVKKSAPGYFIPVVATWDELLAERWLGLPATVFGSTREDLTVLSTLAYL